MKFTIWGTTYEVLKWKKSVTNEPKTSMYEGGLAVKKKEHEIKRRMGLQKEQLIALYTGPMTREQLMKECSRTNEEIGRDIGNLNREGLIVQTSGGSYRLSEKGLEKARFFLRNPRFTVVPKHTMHLGVQMNKKAGN